MNIVTDRPPNFAAIVAVSPMAADKNVLFAWGDTIFSPGGDYVPIQLVAHEEVHSRQQADMGPEAWWDRYLINPVFRYHQELPAHIVEYHEFIKHTRRRASRREYLNAVAARLSGPLYGNVVTTEEAVATIKRGILEAA